MSTPRPHALLSVCLVLLLAAPIARAQESLSRAMQAVRSGDWEVALDAASGRLEGDIVLWHALRAGQGDADTLRAFLARNGDWPGLPYLREKSEGTIAAASPGEVRSFFANHTPQTGEGALVLARALSAQGERAAAQAVVVEAWRTLALSDTTQAAFLRDWGGALTPHHTARLDHALWQGWTNNARAMLPLVDNGWRRLAEARIALRDGENGVDARIAAVPSALSGDPGLAYERFRWRDIRGRDADAIALMRERSEMSDGLGRPEAWARARRNHARNRMRAGAVLEAYYIASKHQLSEGSDYADLEWLAGYISLRFLDRADLAAWHFQRFGVAVDTPISMGRAGYWLGRAEEAQGNAEAARNAYAYGAQYQTSFYGLLAAERGGFAPDPALAGTASVPDWRRAAFTRSRVYDAGIALLEAGQTQLGERFLTHLAESLDAQQIAQMGAMLEDMGKPHVQVMVGKRAAQYGMEVHAPYYALHPLIMSNEYPVPREMVLAIARRESEFDPGVISPVGARGFMQLMPNTAREMANATGESYSSGRLLSDPGYNARLGSAYLAKVAAEFDGNVVLMSAAYNAGPSRPTNWMQRYGDPRSGRVDVIDWIEFIPFDETRNYVMRVAESLPIYRARMGDAPHPIPFSAELAGSTMRAR